MALSDRLKHIEQRLSALEQLATGTDQGLAQLVGALEAEAGDDEAGPTQTLDGEEEGGERDQNQEL